MHVSIKCKNSSLTYFVAPPMHKKIYNWICGYQDGPKEKMTEEQKAEFRKQLTNIEENPFWSQICDINAIIAVGLTCFIIGFYA